MGNDFTIAKKLYDELIWNVPLVVTISKDNHSFYKKERVKKAAIFLEEDTIVIKTTPYTEFHLKIDNPNMRNLTWHNNMLKFYHSGHYFTFERGVDLVEELYNELIKVNPLALTITKLAYDENNNAMEDQIDINDLKIYREHLMIIIEGRDVNNPSEIVKHYIDFYIADANIYRFKWNGDLNLRFLYIDEYYIFRPKVFC